MTAEILDDEWNRYRRACDRVDLLRYDRSFDGGASLTDRLATAETPVSFIDDAIEASTKLTSAAERQADIDQEWLVELREFHKELRNYRDTTQILIADTSERLRQPR